MVIYQKEGYSLYVNRIITPSMEELIIGEFRKVRDKDGSPMFVFRYNGQLKQVRINNFVQDMKSITDKSKPKSDPVYSFKDDVIFNRRKDPLIELSLNPNNQYYQAGLIKVYDNRNMTEDQMVADFKQYVISPPKPDFIASKEYRYPISRIDEISAETQNGELVVSYQYTYEQNDKNNGMLMETAKLEFPIFPKQESRTVGGITIKGGIYVLHEDKQIKDEEILNSLRVIGETELQSPQLDRKAEQIKRDVDKLIDSLNPKGTSKSFAKELNKSLLTDKSKRPKQDILSNKYIQLGIIGGMTFMIFNLVP